MKPELDFPLLDDILPLLAGGDDEARASIRSAQHCALGPLVECAYHAGNQPTDLPPLTELTNSPAARELRRVLGRGGFDNMAVVTSHQARETEFHWVPPEPEAFSAPAWVMFQRRLLNAAEKAGFSRGVAPGLTGAFGEMADNAFRHSLRPLTAVAGYRWSEGAFEYVVADAGQGVLASLRSCPDYADLQDSGDALRMALTEGESCLGRGSGRGRGFRQVFVSLSNLHGRLRVRSGDHVLTIDGTSLVSPAANCHRQTGRPATPSGRAGRPAAAAGTACPLPPGVLHRSGPADKGQKAPHARP